MNKLYISSPSFNALNISLFKETNLVMTEDTHFKLFSQYDGLHKIYGPNKLS